jgi:hypothetical protein
MRIDKMNDTDFENTNHNRSWWEMVKHCSGNARDRRNQYVFVAFLLAWALSSVTANWLLQSDHGIEGPTVWLIALFPNIFGVGAVLAYLKFLRRTDELLRLIQLEGLAYGFGAGVIFMTAYPLLQRAGAPELQLSDAIVVMMVGWSAGQLFAMRRYR